MAGYIYSNTRESQTPHIQVSERWLCGKEHHILIMEIEESVVFWWTLRGDLYRLPPKTHQKPSGAVVDYWVYFVQHQCLWLSCRAPHGQDRRVREQGWIRAGDPYITNSPSFHPSILSLTSFIRQSGDSRLCPPRAMHYSAVQTTCRTPQMSGCVCVFNHLNRRRRFRYTHCNPQVQRVGVGTAATSREIVPIPKKSYRSPEITVNLQVVGPLLGRSVL